MLGHIYYFFGLLLFLIDLGLLMRFNKVQKIKNWIESFYKVTQKKPKKEDMNSEDYKIVNAYETLVITNFLWIFFGLITKSWKLYVIVLVLNFFVNFILMNVKRYQFLNYIFELIRFLLILICVGFAVINHFHLHIDIINLLMK
jgi:hypothetical protein